MTSGGTVSGDQCVYNTPAPTSTTTPNPQPTTTPTQVEVPANKDGSCPVGSHEVGGSSGSAGQVPDLLFVFRITQRQQLAEEQHHRPQRELAKVWSSPFFHKCLVHVLEEVQRLGIFVW